MSILKFQAKTVIKRFNQDMWDFLGLDILNDSTYLAGGAFRYIFNKKDYIDDFDVFFQDLKTLGQVKERLEANEAINTFTCPEGKLYSYAVKGLKVQLITEREYSSPEELLRVFDINACRFCLYQDSFYTDKTAINDVKKKLVTFNRIDYPVATSKRIAKYRDKGYFVPTVSYEDFVFSIYQKGTSGENIDMRFYID